MTVEVRASVVASALRLQPLCPAARALLHSLWRQLPHSDDVVSRATTLLDLIVPEVGEGQVSSLVDGSWLLPTTTTSGDLCTAICWLEARRELYDWLRPLAPLKRSPSGAVLTLQDDPFHFFSVTHSHGSCAVARSSSPLVVGVDVSESIGWMRDQYNSADREGGLDPCLAHAFTLDEWQYITAGCDADPVRWLRLFQLWTMKECVIKVLGNAATEEDAEHSLSVCVPLSMRSISAHEASHHDAGSVSDEIPHSFPCTLANDGMCVPYGDSPVSMDLPTSPVHIDIPGGSSSLWYYASRVLFPTAHHTDHDSTQLAPSPVWSFLSLTPEQRSQSIVLTVLVRPSRHFNKGSSSFPYVRIHTRTLGLSPTI